MAPDPMERIAPPSQSELGLGRTRKRKETSLSDMETDPERGPRFSSLLFPPTARLFPDVQPVG